MELERAHNKKCNHQGEKCISKNNSVTDTTAFVSTHECFYQEETPGWTTELRWGNSSGLKRGS